MLKKIFLFIALVFLSAAIVQAQVTTSSASGTVKGLNNEALIGASVEMIHVPTGTKYSTITKAGGNFSLQNLNPGGPYTLEVTNVGYEAYKLTEINIPLGEIYQAAVNLTNSSQQLSEVTVSATSRSQRIGAATNISRTQILNVPNINRSLMDVTKLTPQANGNSFLGMSNRFNNITVDGSVFNNNFGLGGSALPGGASQPISIDAIDQVQVNLAPFDVRQAGFTGAGVNAVTRRGTNEIYATVYDYYKNQSFNGTKVDGTKLPDALKSSSNIFGASVGGPIIKNKLFFFLNGEIDRRTAPGQSWVPKTSANDANPNAVPNVLESDMIKLSDHLKSKYGYDPGSYSGYDFETANTKLLARIDWNINDNNRFSLRYNQAKTSDDVLVNTSSGPNPRINNGRRGGSLGGLAFANSNYKQNNNVYSIVGELNSKFNSNVSNQFLASFTKIHDFRETPGEQFPFVDIMRDGGNVLMSFGSELYSYNNYVKNNTINIADNVSWSLGKHNILAGASLDYMTFENSFANFGGQSYYRFASLQDFLENKAPTVFALTYSNKDRAAVQAAKANFAQFGFYLQDEFAVNDRLKLTYGARFDLPFYPGDKVSNDSLYAIPLRDPSGKEFRADVGVWPKARLLVSPRVGFTYTAGEDRSWIIRGGTGIFTGRIPFVWLVNQSSDNGVLNTQVTYTTNMGNYLFNPDRTAHAPATLPPTVGIIAGSYYSVTSPDFKIPQVWRSNLAVDKNLGGGFVATFEGIYSKTINGVYHYNANLGDVKGPRTGFGGDNRNTYNNAYSSKVGQVFVMDNTSKGYSYALTAQLAKRFSKNWQASVSYTYAEAKDASPNNGDRSQSAWTQNTIISNPNDPELGYSSYNVPHRINAYASYRFEYANNNLATTLSLFYSGASQERYLYRFGGDINGDGASTNDLFFVPESRTGLETQFTTLTERNPDNTVKKVHTPVEQADAFWAFIENDKNLRNRKGQYVGRYDALLPWLNQLDFRLLQDIKPTIGNKKHTLQLSVDIRNVLNMLNSGWGNRYTYNYGGFSDQGILGVSSGKYTFKSDGAKSVYSRYYDPASTWNMQVGIRYIF